jgi:hypothetical protein
MLKRLLGSALRARTYWSQCRETVLRGLTLNVMILRRPKVFDRAGGTRFASAQSWLGTAEKNLGAVNMREVSMDDQVLGRALFHALKSSPSEIE